MSGSGTGNTPESADRIAEVIAEGYGFWRTCSGCHETEDGHDVGHYPYSPTFQAKLGGGCRECGGLGAIWDNTDYGKMVDDFLSRDREMEARKNQPLHVALAADAADMVLSDPEVAARIRRAVELLLPDAEVRAVRA